MNAPWPLASSIPVPTSAAFLSPFGLPYIVLEFCRAHFTSAEHDPWLARRVFNHRSFLTFTWIIAWLLIYQETAKTILRCIRGPN